MSYIDHPSQARDYIQPFPDKLHVVAVFYNPQMWHKRLVNHRAFEKRVIDSGGIPYVIELAFGDRPFEIIDPNNPCHLGLRTLDELWHKERMIKIGIRQLLPKDARYVAWWDGDIGFSKPNICQEVLQALQHHYIVQCFSHAVDLGPNDEPMWTTPGFMFEWVNHGTLDEFLNNKPFKPASYYDTEPKRVGWSPISPGFDKDWKICHPGLAWAADLQAFDKIDGGIFDISIYGSGDWIMALSWVGLAHLALASTKDTVFSRAVMRYQEICEDHIHRDVGYVPGTVYHYWHGRKADRRYAVRPNALLVELGYNPETDIKRDRNGLYVLNTSRDPRSQKIRDVLRFFARVRNEDSVEL